MLTLHVTKGKTASIAKTIRSSRLTAKGSFFAPALLLPLWILTGFWLLVTSVYANNTIKVVVSIPPLHALTAGVMEGIGKPDLLLQSGASVHHYSLKPSDFNKLQHASLVVWGGPELEAFLVNPLNNLISENKTIPGILTLASDPKLRLLKSRLGPSLPEEDHHHTIYDMHFWLDPTNAKIMVNAIAKKLSELDPAHKAQYDKNAKNLKIALDTLDKNIKINLKNVQQAPFLVFHDAYQYFEQRYGLRAVASLTIHPEIPISSKRRQEIEDIIKQKHIRCVFTEPQFSPSLVQGLAEDFPIKVGVLDPLGKETKQGADGYFVLMNNLTESFKSCLMMSTPKTH